MKPDFIDNLELPVVAAPMFLISGPKLVIECCKNGIIGTFPALNQKTTEGFESWVIEIKEKPSMRLRRYQLIGMTMSTLDSTRRISNRSPTAY